MRGAILALENVVVCSHRGWVTRENLARFMRAVVDNILAFLDGRPERVLNPEAPDVRRHT